MAEVTDKSSVVPDYVLLFLITCRDRYIKEVERINGLIFYCIAKRKSTKIQLLLKPKDGRRGNITRCRLRGKNFGLVMRMTSDLLLCAFALPISLPDN